MRTVSKRWLRMLKHPEMEKEHEAYPGYEIRNLGSETSIIEPVPSRNFEGIGSKWCLAIAEQRTVRQLSLKTGPKVVCRIERRLRVYNCLVDRLLHRNRPMISRSTPSSTGSRQLRTIGMPTPQDPGWPIREQDLVRISEGLIPRVDNADMGSKRTLVAIDICCIGEILKGEIRLLFLRRKRERCAITPAAHHLRGKQLLSL